MMSVSEPNELQKAFFVQAMNSLAPGSGDRLADQPAVIMRWLQGAKPIVAALAGFGRAAIENERGDQNTMRSDAMKAMD